MGEVMLDRRATVAALLRDRGDMLVVTGLGSAAYDVMAAGDHDRNYYLWAAMGSAAMVGFGLARAQPELPVVVITGDGEAMMGLGGLASIAAVKPENLTIVVLDNGHFGETGMQVSHTGLGLDLARVAAAMDYPETEVITRMDQVAGLRSAVQAKDGLRLAVVKVASENPTRVLPPRDGVYIKNRFRAALGHAPI